MAVELAGVFIWKTNSPLLAFHRIPRVPPTGTEISSSLRAFYFFVFLSCPLHPFIKLESSHPEQSRKPNHLVAGQIFLTQQTELIANIKIARDATAYSSFSLLSVYCRCLSRHKIRVEWQRYCTNWAGSHPGLQH